MDKERLDRFARAVEESRHILRAMREATQLNYQMVEQSQEALRRRGSGGGPQAGNGPVPPR